MKESTLAFERFFQIIKKLRGPGGCPWDKDQTPQSIRKNLVEEAWECVEAINEANEAHVREELGDVLLVTIMMAWMYEEQGSFTVSEVFEGVSDKLVRRHPHVFGDAQAKNAQEVLEQWQHIKVNVEGRKPKNSVLDDISSNIPVLERAWIMQKKAAKLGFDWLKIEDVWEKAFEELEETREASTTTSQEKIEEELGDLLFSVINIARFLHVDPSLALQRTSSKFDRRFRYVEASMKKQGLDMSPETFDTMDQLWNDAKAQEKDT